jgi:hypothetical protein
MRGESAKAYTAFRRFRDLGPSRSLAGVRAIERRWSWRWRWSQRAAAWDMACWRRRDDAELRRVGGDDDPWAAIEQQLAADVAEQLRQRR